MENTQTPAIHYYTSVTEGLVRENQNNENSHLPLLNSNLVGMLSLDNGTQVISTQIVHNTIEPADETRANTAVEHATFNSSITIPSIMRRESIEVRNRGSSSSVQINESEVIASNSARLIQLAKEGNYKAIQSLLNEAVVDINAVNESGRTALMWATMANCKEGVRILLTAPGIDVNAADKYGYTALMFRSC